MPMRASCCGVEMVWVGYSPAPPAHVYECVYCGRKQLLRVVRPSPRYLYIGGR